MTSTSGTVNLDMGHSPEFPPLLEIVDTGPLTRESNDKVNVRVDIDRNKPCEFVETLSFDLNRMD